MVYWRYARLLASGARVESVHSITSTRDPGARPLGRNTPFGASNSTRNPPRVPLSRMAFMTMPRRTRWIRLFAAGLFLICIVGWGWLETHRQPAIGSKIVLQDGRELTLGAITFGTQHRADFGSGLTRLLQRLPGNSIPSWRWLERISGPTQTGTASFSEPHLVLWFIVPPSSQPPAKPTRSESPSPPHPPRLSSRAREMGYSALRWKVNGEGDAYQGGTACSSVGSGSGVGLFSIEIPCYPRRRFLDDSCG